ncbi:MAG: TonB-dependent receptor [Salinivirgaceae bacterium]|nr:TonB-dependent receptor [Salinivirgaceae bacterium]
MKNIILILLILAGNMAVAQKHTISGVVRDAASGELLPSANVYLNTGVGTVTNNYGFFAITTNQSPITLNVSYVGYSVFKQTFTTTKDTVVDIKISSDNQIEEVVVSDNSAQTRLRSSQFNVANITMKEVAQLPTLLGEHDVLKAMQTMPGIGSGGDGMTGLYVRGGSPDQNLILLDGAPVYNANHLFGFLSVFNAEAIKSVSVLKGGFPARYGGRLSSVLDIQMKEGNTNETHGMASVGLLSSQLAIEGPINDKTSYLFTLRRAYFDLIMWPMCKLADIRDGVGKTSAGYHFTDINAKINYRLDAKNQVFASFYSGLDKFRSAIEFPSGGYDVDDKFKLNWQNQTATLRYNRTIGNKLFMNTSLIYSRYKYFTKSSVRYDYFRSNSYEYSSARGESALQDWSAKFDFDWYPAEKHIIRSGMSITRHSFSPEQSAYESGYSEDATTVADTAFGTKKVKSADFSAYIEDDWTISKHLKANLGARYTLFNVEGRNYTAIEPRASLCLLLNDNLSLKAAYSKMTQYVHLVSNSSVGMPTDQWLPSTKRIKPETSDQISLGLQYNTPDYEFTAEGFYKKMNDLIEYREGANYMSYQNWEDKLTSGRGEAYGLEFMAKKSAGRTTGWVSYTLSWSNRTFAELNNGEQFPFKYDRRHDLSIVAMHTFSKKFDISANWNISSGSHVTLPIARYIDLDGEEAVAYSKRNEYRMPLYHRLDVSANLNRPKRRGTATWTFGVYNIYARQNPLYIYAGSEKDEYLGEARYFLKKVSVLTIVPTISYKFKF